MLTSRRAALALLVWMPFQTTLAADDFVNLAALGSQENFRLFSRDLAGALSYKGVLEAAPMGRQGYDFGLQVDSTKLENPGLWDTACGCAAPARVVTPKAYLRLGAEEADITLSYGKPRDTSLALFGVEVQYALALEAPASPAISLRVNYSRMSGAEQLDFDVTGAELAISKRFGAITPYAGGGRLWATSNPKTGGFAREKFNADKYYGGVNFALGANAHLAIEVGTAADASSYSAKLVWRF